MKFHLLLIISCLSVNTIFGKITDTLAKVYGDLNKDKIPEMVLVLNTDENSTNDLGTIRVVHIYKKNNKGAYQLWHNNQTIVLPSQHGGMMGDPFESAAIKNGTLIINHFGGSADKWHYTHRYRFQKNDWQLVGTTINYGREGEETFVFDYNLSTNKGTYTTNLYNGTTQPIITKTSFTKALPPISMKNFVPGNLEFNLGKAISVYF